MSFASQRTVSEETNTANVWISDFQPTELRGAHATPSAVLFYGSLADECCNPVTEGGSQGALTAGSQTVQVFTPETAAGRTAEGAPSPHLVLALQPAAPFRSVSSWRMRSSFHTCCLLCLFRLSWQQEYKDLPWLLRS